MCLEYPGQAVRDSAMDCRRHDNAYADGNPAHHHRQSNIFLLDNLLPEMIRGQPVDDEKGNPEDKNSDKGIQQRAEYGAEFNLFNHVFPSPFLRFGKQSPDPLAYSSGPLTHGKNSGRGARLCALPRSLAARSGNAPYVSQPKSRI